MPSSASLLAAVTALGVAVLAYGVGSLLQAMAARKHPERSATSLLFTPLVLGGLTLDVLGFLAGALALTELPLFFVQGASSASILVTALLASVVLRERPDRQEALAMPLVLAGLVALAAAAEPGPAETPPAVLVVGLVVGLPLFGLGGWYCVRHRTRVTAIGLAVLAGLSYGCASLAARGASAPELGRATIVPLLLLVAAHALQGVALVTVAMRRAPVNTVTSVLFATEALGPAATGLLLLGDRTAEGLGWAAGLGCLFLVAATVLLTRPEPGSTAETAETTGTAETIEARTRPRVDLRPDHLRPDHLQPAPASPTAGHRRAPARSVVRIPSQRARSASGRHRVER